LGEATCKEGERRPASKRSQRKARCKLDMSRMLIWAVVLLAHELGLTRLLPPLAQGAVRAVWGLGAEASHQA